MVRVVLLIVERVLDPHRQAEILFAAADKRGFDVAMVSRCVAECVAAVRRGDVDQVVSIAEDAALAELGDQAVVLRPRRRAMRTQVDLVDLVRRWRERGMPLSAIAELLAMEVVQVEILARLGIEATALPGGRRPHRLA